MTVPPFRTDLRLAWIVAAAGTRTATSPDEPRSTREPEYRKRTVRLVPGLMTSLNAPAASDRTRPTCTKLAPALAARE